MGGSNHALTYSVPQYSLGNYGGQLAASQGLTQGLAAAQTGSFMNILSETAAKSAGNNLGKMLATLGAGFLTGGMQMLGQYMAAKNERAAEREYLERKYARTPGQAKVGSMVINNALRMGGYNRGYNNYVTGATAATGGIKPLPYANENLARRRVI